jgi:hypothetical protein
MAISCGIFTMSGGGKTTSIVINPDGTYNPSDYQGMDPETTIIINGDGKELPFKQKGVWVANKNVFTTSDQLTIMKILDGASKSTKIKVVIIDTINSIMLDKEMLETKKLTFDKWADLAKDIYSMIVDINGLRKDLVVYLLGHVTLYTDVDGNESKCLITNGKKLEKIKLESKLPVVLFGKVDRGAQGDNKFFFETQSNRSTGKTPLGMFADFQIPNSLKLVDDTIRKYYEI